VHPDVMVVDPPRNELAPRVTDRILSMGVPFLAYVSCDPSTLARDVRRLQGGGYQLVQVMPFDLFPQTYHIESISLFSR
jgi:23S rRNA (uracil1939-C5)-methyltransferase